MTLDLTIMPALVAADRVLRTIQRDTGYMRILNAVLDVNPRIIIAGGSMVPNAEINDIDVFPSATTLQVPTGLRSDCKVSSTPNATTIVCGSATVQLCKYHAPTLRDLIETFDFSHVQAGMIVGRAGDGRFAWFDSDATDGALTAWETGSTRYTGSAFPLSSLVRSLKYAERGWIKGRGAQMATTFAIMADICTRGFVNYNDFKTQLDAIDLGVVDDEYRADLLTIFKALQK